MLDPTHKYQTAGKAPKGALNTIQDTLVPIADYWIPEAVLPDPQTILKVPPRLMAA